MRIGDMIGTMLPKKKGDAVRLWSEWGLQVSGASQDPGFVPLPEYPRPQFVRGGYRCLNGWWEYKIAPADRWEKPAELFSGPMDGRILVPFSPETALSGAGHILQPDELIWYQRTVGIRRRPGYRLLLHFGAADQSCVVWWNRKRVGAHLGGYLPFTFDVTDVLAEGENLLSVMCMDVTDRSYHARGKQSLTPGGIWYTPQSGLWQTVWCEWVPAVYVKSWTLRPDGDTGKLSVSAVLSEAVKAPFPAKLRVSAGADVCAEAEGTLCRVTHGSGLVTTEVRFEAQVPDVRRWTPEDPFLYQLELEAGEDYAEGYTAFRTVTVETDGKGYKRVCLNHKPVFLNGLLDQGYWPDGLYTAPTDEALASDIVRMKELGFNMLRKHIKIEPARWYYHCDRLGMLVWQDMVNGGSTYRTASVAWLPTVSRTLAGQKGYTAKGSGRTDPAGCREWLSECRQTVRLLRNTPSVIGWVPFNEGWGQFETKRVTDMIRRMDPTRTIDSASGWFDAGCGDFASVHNYFSELTVPEDEHGRARVISEYGGVNLQIPGHTYRLSGAYGYAKTDSGKAFREKFYTLQARVRALEAEGLAGAVYTQVTDVEEETNGLLTWDRKVCKLTEDDGD